jgi:hypothetical protein
MAHRAWRIAHPASRIVHRRASRVAAHHTSQLSQIKPRASQMVFIKR